jgi:DNA-binding response OmpR family regulator
MKLLLAEDTRDLNRALTAVLNHEKYDVDSVFDGEEALNRLMAGSYDGIILDIMMPKKSGLEVLSSIRKSNILTPVLLLTAKAEVDDRVAGLDAGADDYLTKPFAMKELLARVRSLTRRNAKYSEEELRFADIVLNAENFELTAENSVRLSIREVELMQTLIRNAGRELTTDTILDLVWNKDPEAGEDTVWLYISYLRGKLQAIDSHVEISGKRGGSFMLVDCRDEDSEYTGRDESEDAAED